MRQMYWQVGVFLLILLGVESKAQSSDPMAKRYRVTAFKASNTAITSLSNIAEAGPKSTIYIPSAFTPNGDGINDRFGVKALNITQFNLKIFNRWGELIFETDEVTNLWDGTYNGQAITSTDVFVYTVKAKGPNGIVLPEESGTVTLVADGTVD